MFDVIEHLPTIQRLARSVSVQRADDLTSVGVIAAYRVAETYTPERGKFTKYLNTVVWRDMKRYCHTDRLIRLPWVQSRLAVTRQLATSAQQIQSISDMDWIPDRQTGYDDRESRLDAARKTLNATEAELIGMRYDDGKAFRQIASEMKRPLNQVMDLHQTALQSIKAQLNEWP